MSKFTQTVRDGLVLYDGSKGVMLQLKGLKGNECAEYWNIVHPEKVREVYDGYIGAGSDMIQTNTFCANAPSLKNHGLEDQLYEINMEGARLALECAKGTDVMVAASVGPTSLFFEPAGDMTFEMAVDIFKQQLQPLKDAGLTIVNFETFTDLNEMRAAITAAREIGGFDIISSMTFDDGRTMSGNPPEVCAVVCAGMGAAVVGANCSGGPDTLLDPIRKMQDTVAIPLSAKPNAGLPEMIDGQAVFSQTPEVFAKMAQEFAQVGVRLIGGCCGSTPDHIAALRQAVDAAVLSPLQDEQKKVIASQYVCVSAGADTLLYAVMEVEDAAEGIGEGDFYCLMDVLPEDAADADVLVVDFGTMRLCFDMWEFMTAFTTFVKKPVLVKAQDKMLIEKFMRYYPGVAGIA